MSRLAEIRERAGLSRWRCDSCGHENNEACPECRTRQRRIADGVVIPPLNDAGYLLARLDEAVALLRERTVCRTCFGTGRMEIDTKYGGCTTMSCLGCRQTLKDADVVAFLAEIEK